MGSFSHDTGPSVCRKKHRPSFNCASVSHKRDEAYAWSSAGKKREKAKETGLIRTGCYRRAKRFEPDEFANGLSRQYRLNATNERERGLKGPFIALGWSGRFNMSFLSIFLAVGHFLL